MKDRDTAELTACPLGLILSKVWLHRIEERPNEGYLPRWANDAMFLELVRDYTMLESPAASRGSKLEAYIDRT